MGASRPNEHWDDASLHTAIGIHAITRAGRTGFWSLNDVERVSACLFHLEGDVNNGGFGQWLYGAPPELLYATPDALKTIGDSEMAALVREVLAQVGDLGNVTTEDQWHEHLDSLPESVHEKIDSYSERYTALESAFLDHAYAFARVRWREVPLEDT